MSLLSLSPEFVEAVQYRCRFDLYHNKLPLFCVRKFIKTELGNLLNDIECKFASLVLFSKKCRRLAKARECGKGRRAS